MKQQIIVRGFEIIASLLVVMAIAALTCYMVQEVGADRFPWWPYPAFALFAAVIFAIYGLISKDEEL